MTLHVRGDLAIYVAMDGRDPYHRDGRIIQLRGM